MNALEQVTKATGMPIRTLMQYGLILGIVLVMLGPQTSEPLIHPETGLAITTTGQHWYGQEPLALSEGL